MRLFRAFLGAVLTCLVGAALGHAESIPWSFLTPSMEGIGSRQGASGALQSITQKQDGGVFFNAGAGAPFPEPFTGSADLVAFRLSKYGGVSEEGPDPAFFGLFDDSRYRLTVELHDETSGAVGSFAFTGAFNGQFTATTFDVTNTFDSPVTQSQRLGDNVYTVTIGPFLPPGPTNDIEGSIGAHVEVAPADVQESPEPSSLVLASLGIAAACGAGLRRIRRDRRHVPAA